MCKSDPDFEPHAYRDCECPQTSPYCLPDHTCASTLEKIDSFPKLEQLCEELNPDSSKDWKMSLYALIEAEFEKSSKHLDSMADFLINQVICDAGKARQILNDFVSKISMGETMKPERAKFMETIFVPILQQMS